MKSKIINRCAEVYIYSGRPNPKWLLSTGQIKSWKQQWTDAPLSGYEVQRPAVLGYTGCRLQYDEHAYWIIYDGRISFYEEGKITSREDQHRRMELFLLRTSTGEAKEILHSLELI